MNKEIFSKIFLKIYFLYSKEKLNKTLDDFKNWNNNEVFDDLFNKMNSVMVMFTNKTKPTYNYKKRIYSLFKTIVSTNISSISYKRNGSPSKIAVV